MLSAPDGATCGIVESWSSSYYRSYIGKKQSQLTKLLSGSVETLFSCSIFNAVRSKEKHLYALLLLLVNTIVSSLVSGIKLTGAHERHCPLLIISRITPLSSFRCNTWVHCIVVVQTAQINESSGICKPKIHRRNTPVNVICNTCENICISCFVIWSIFKSLNKFGILKKKRYFR